MTLAEFPLAQLPRVAGKHVKVPLRFAGFIVHREADHLLTVAAGECRAVGSKALRAAALHLRETFNQVDGI